MKNVLKLLSLILLIQTISLTFGIGHANEVKVIYFYPNDRTPQADINDILDSKLKSAQEFFSSVLELYGYGRKTFVVETGSDGKVVVNHVQGENNDEHYHESTIRKVQEELYDEYDSSQNIYYVAVDISEDVFIEKLLGNDVRACGVALGNWALTPAMGHCFNFSVIAHELGHTFGLDHDAFSTGNIDPMINSSCSAAWLDRHPCLNGGNSDSGPTEITTLTPRLAPEEGKVRFRFEISDPDGLFMARLFIYEIDTVVLCHELDDIDITLSIDTGYIPKSDTSAKLTIMDKSGNYIDHFFDLDTATILNSNTEIQIPDPNLAAIIRENLNLAAGERFTDQSISRLTSLELVDTNRPITDLTGLEKAENLETLVIRDQQTIRDFSPLQTITKLIYLEISNSGFSELSILSQLTNLQHLKLANNDIQDISVLFRLTSLITLDLSNNQISDVSPLLALVNLEHLSVQGNPIVDTSPLETIQEQNPDLQHTIPTDTEPDEEIPNREPTFVEGESAVRWVLENSPVGTNIGSRIGANDSDNDILTYSIISYDDQQLFDIGINNGQLKTKTILDYNTQSLYEITVSVSDGEGGSASIAVSIYVAPAAQDIILPELIPIRVSFSELMFTTKGGVHSLSQWIELYNGSETEEVNLRGWQLAIEARDRNGKHRHGIIPLKNLHIPARDTALIVTWHAIQKSDVFPDEQIYNFFSHHFDEWEQNQYRNMIIGLEGFSLKLTNREGLLVDAVGNLDGDPSTQDEPAWEIPAGKTNTGTRTSLMRRYTMETLEPIDGTEADSWRRAADFTLAVSTYWGLSSDIGNPGYRTSGTLPVTLSHFRADITDKGAVLTWTTESEIENAGFYIHRSETRDGVFKVINAKLIQGAGTTGKRNKYTWTDTTIKPDTRYYYRIVDVSFAGVQQELATVGLQGLLSPDKKQLTSWANLKK